MVTKLGGVVECRTDGSKLPIDNRSGYVGNATIDDIDLADEIFLIGSNPRNEAPVQTLEYGKHGLKERKCIC